MRIPRKPPRAPSIDMTPMIDCVFQLLIFFMLSNAFLAPMMQVNLAHAKTADPNKLQEIVVSVSADGVFEMDGARVDPARLEVLLRPRIAQSAHKAVRIRGDQHMPFKHFVRALDAARASGAQHLHIEHVPPP